MSTSTFTEEERVDRSRNRVETTGKAGIILRRKVYTQVLFNCCILRRLVYDCIESIDVSKSSRVYREKERDVALDIATMEFVFFVQTSIMRFRSSSSNLLYWISLSSILGTASAASLDRPLAPSFPSNSSADSRLLLSSQDLPKGLVTLTSDGELVAIDLETGEPRKSVPLAV